MKDRGVKFIWSCLLSTAHEQGRGLVDMVSVSYQLPNSTCTNSRLAVHIPMDEVSALTIEVLGRLGGYTGRDHQQTRCGNSYLAPCNMLFCGLKRVEDSGLPKLSKCSRMPLRHIEGSVKTCCYKSQGSNSPVANWHLILLQFLHQSLGFLRM